MRRFRFIAICGAISGLAALAPLAAQHNPLAMLGSLQKGRWSVSSADGGPNRTICLADPTMLIQLRHADVACSRFVVEDEASTVTIQYTCKGKGYGRTSIRRETPSLVQIESQGIDGGLPFQFKAEARRVGACK